MTIQRRLAKLESVIRVPVCARRDGKWMGYIFNPPSPEDYEARVDPETGEHFAAVLPPHCPSCGRVIPKLWIVGSRASFDRGMRSRRR